MAQYCLKNVQMANQAKRTVSAIADWRDRMIAARATLKDLSVSERMLLVWIISKHAEFDSLLNKDRWLRVWHGRVADVELIEWVEQAVDHFQTEGKKQKNKRPSMGKMKPPIE